MIRDLLWAWLPWIYNKGSSSISLVKRVALVAHNEIMIDKRWIILKNVYIPIYSSFFPNMPVDTIKWSCETNPPRFINPDHVLSKFKHISYLGFIVNISENEKIDLTEWINTVMWKGKEEPSLLDLFTIWCCETGHSYFHTIPSVSVDIITDSGDSVTKGLNDYVINYSSNGSNGYK